MPYAPNAYTSDDVGRVHRVAPTLADIVADSIDEVSYWCDRAADVLPSFAARSPFGTAALLHRLAIAGSDAVDLLVQCAHESGSMVDVRAVHADLIGADENGPRSGTRPYSLDEALTDQGRSVRKANGEVGKRGEAFVTGRVAPECETDDDGTVIARVILRSARTNRAGLTSTIGLDALATRLFGIDKLVGTEHLSFEQMIAGDVTSASETAWRNARDPWHAARSRGLISRDEYATVREVCGHTLPTGARPIPVHRRRMTLPLGPERNADSVAATIGAWRIVATHPDRTDIARELVAPATDLDHRFVGHRKVKRAAVGAPDPRRSVGRIDPRLAVLFLEPGAPITMTGPNGGTVRISRSATSGRVAVITADGKRYGASTDTGAVAYITRQ